jgi:cytochrome c peroxidase
MRARRKPHFNPWTVWLPAAIAVAMLLGGSTPRPYTALYHDSLAALETRERALLAAIETTDCATPAGRQSLTVRIHDARRALKDADLWLRYLEPAAYERLNGQVPVEWENEVYEPVEPPDRRIGSGLSLAEMSLEDSTATRDSLRTLIREALAAHAVFAADSITRQLERCDPFFLANRLFLLNLASIYTTGFECPDTASVIPELGDLLAGVTRIYAAYDQSFPDHPLPPAYLDRFERMRAFVAEAPRSFSGFDRFVFIRDHVDPLFVANQDLIERYGVRSTSPNDYAINDRSRALFDRTLFSTQNTGGVFSMVRDTSTRADIRRVGRLLFYDPILSGNNQRACASCHHPAEFFAHPEVTTDLTFDRQHRLPRNTPSLVDVVFHQLLMLDGKHRTLLEQARGVITNPIEMASREDDVVRKVMSCREYRTAFQRFLGYIPEEKRVTLDVIISALTSYYGVYSNGYSDFDEAMLHGAPLDADARRGFNLFMSKAQCGTCHYVPQFNGMKPPFTDTEFEVLGTPADTMYRALSDDPGRFDVHAVPEMKHAFRTPTVRNAERTAPYMHNGVFRTLDQVIDFYDRGGGAGHGLEITNQTLSPDSLGLTAAERADLKAFLHALNERVVLDTPPAALPASSDRTLNHRHVGGEY